MVHDSWSTVVICACSIRVAIIGHMPTSRSPQLRTEQPARDYSVAATATARKLFAISINSQFMVPCYGAYLHTYDTIPLHALVTRSNN
jgi:hypothetical protein